mgnify:CR=1 FL=1
MKSRVSEDIIPANMRILSWCVGLISMGVFSVFGQVVSTNTQPLTNGTSTVWTNVAPGLLAARATNFAGTNNAFSLLKTQVKALAFDSELKVYTAKRGETKAYIVFNLTNVTEKEVVVTGTHTTCGCTVAKLPSTPWILPAGATGQLQVAIDLLGKTGTLLKPITLFLANSAQVVHVKVVIPPTPVLSEEERAKNMRLSKADPQAVFSGSCAACHLTPGNLRMGGDLYATMCGVCHESSRRATMVPDLHKLQKKYDFEKWKDVISNGTTNSLMPAFSMAKGGPLSEAQINSLADYMNKAFSRNFRVKHSGVSQTNRINVLKMSNPLLPVPATPEVPVHGAGNAVVQTNSVTPAK